MSRRLWLPAVLAAIGYGLLAWQLAGWVRSTAMEDLVQDGARQLKLNVAHLNGRLAKYEVLPELIATNPRLVDVLRNPRDPERIRALNRYLETVNAIAGAADTYLMDREGLTIAASNWQSPRPFVGRNFSYRPYFRQAMSGHLGRYYALGAASSRRGYYFAYPVASPEGDILGAVVIKVDISEVEEQWRSGEREVLVTDPDGVIFITTRPKWRFHTLTPLVPEVRERIIHSNRYPGARLTPLNLRPGERVAGAARLLHTGRGDGNAAFASLTHPMPAAGWQVHLLLPMAPVDQRVFNALMLLSLLFLATILLVLYQQQARRRRAERVQYAAESERALRDAHDQLERRVAERTAELTASNRRLSREIEEHRRTEETLRQTQDALIQSAKLAVLGQMSAGISHELNQPLAAIRSYADNARRLLERERSADAAWNLGQISELTERMAQISTQLKLYARKSSGAPVAVSLWQSLEAARRILRPQLKSGRPRLDVEVDEGLCTLVDPVHLEQVLVNLLGNAINALEEHPDPLIRVRAGGADGRLWLTIRDNGPGIPDAHLESIFDPFFTTRETGLGLGLSISQRIVEGMDGRLSAANAPDGGAVFTLELPLARGRAGPADGAGSGGCADTGEVARQ